MGNMGRSENGMIGKKAKAENEEMGRVHCRLWIGLGGSLGILVKIFISLIWLKLSKMVMVAFWHILPVHMTGFMVI